MCAYIAPLWKYLCVSIWPCSCFSLLTTCIKFLLLCYTYVCINMYNA